MIRLLSHLFKWNYESCKGCEILKQQLAIANENNARLEETLIGLLQPKVIEQLPVREVPAVKASLNTFTKRREILEAEDRKKVAISTNSPFIAKPDSVIPTDHTKTVGNTNVEKLEQELGIEDAS